MTGSWQQANTPLRDVREMPNYRSAMRGQPAVYMLGSRRNGTLYTGVTSELVKRTWEHKHDAVDGFTKKHGVHQLVWYELHETMASAICREKALKNWKRNWKVDLIEQSNAEWRDLYSSIL